MRRRVGLFVWKGGSSPHHPFTLMDNDDLPSPAGQRPANREDWFTTTPSPWQEVARLQPDGDRSFATTIERMVMNAEPAQRPELERKLIAALQQPGITAAGQLFLCRMLGLIGSPACVAAVRDLLVQEDASHAARIALDSIDDAAVDAAYRDALPQLRGAAKCGLIGSIARRRDQGAIKALTALALDENENREVRAAAERAVEALVAQS
ncbi:MAG TPA: hypothetical protein VNR00_07430 [Opitutus sp.]|nr:hypothetical protein [Opitutus sp.]